MHGDHLVMANAERLFVLDRSWRLLAELSHPLVGSVHDVLAEDDGIWVASTAADLLVKLSWDGDLLEDWEWRRDPGLALKLGFQRVAPVDRALDYRMPSAQHTGLRNIVHLNSVGLGPDHLLVGLGRIRSVKHYRRGRAAGMVGSLAATVQRDRAQRQTQPSRLTPTPASRMPGSASAIVSLDRSRTARLIRHDRGTDLPNHNTIWWRDRLVWCNSNETRLSVSHQGGDGLEVGINLPGAPGFLRGLAHVEDAMFLVGNQAPFAVYLVDVDAQAVRRRYDLHGERAESVYALSILPDSFATPTRTNWLADR